jgi:prepilin-type N-terminal cleavage/methylation domain-containing protein
MSGPSLRRAPAGFTLVELLLVLLVLSLCAAATVRWYFSNADITLENAAVLLARDLRAAQHRSIFLGEPTRVLFLPDGSGYVVTDARGDLAHNPLTDEPFQRVYSDDGVFDGVHVTSALAGDDRTFEIDGRGRPLEDLSVGLRFGSERRTVELDHEHGGITIVGSTSGWADTER